MPTQRIAQYKSSTELLYISFPGIESTNTFKKGKTTVCEESFSPGDGQE